MFLLYIKYIFSAARHPLLLLHRASLYGSVVPEVVFTVPRRPARQQ